MEAERTIRHSTKLGANLQKASPNTLRPPEVDAHHIVAVEDRRAKRARQFIFKVGIGINDADNGVYLPRYKTSRVPSLPQASRHQGIHTGLYYASVYAELVRSPNHVELETRLILKSIKSQLITGIFPF